jgi:hypothetical protein
MILSNSIPHYNIKDDGMYPAAATQLSTGEFVYQALGGRQQPLDLLIICHILVEFEQSIPSMGISVEGTPSLRPSESDLHLTGEAKDPFSLKPLRASF